MCKLHTSTQYAWLALSAREKKYHSVGVLVATDIVHSDGTVVLQSGACSLTNRSWHPEPACVPGSSCKSKFFLVALAQMLAHRGMLGQQ